MKAIIKETGQAVEVVSRFMPKKRNAPSRAWVCVISDGRIIDEDAIEYVAQSHPVPDAGTEAEPKEEKKLPEDLEEAARHYLLGEHCSPLNIVFHEADIKAEMQYHKDIADAFKAGAEWAAEHLKR